MVGMINPDADDFMKDDPPPAQPSKMETSSGKKGKRAYASEVSSVDDRWGDPRTKSGTARERTELFLRENPVPTIIGALMIGLAIGLAIRYASASEEKEVKVKTSLGNATISALSFPFLWPFLKTLKHKYQESADVVKEGVDKLRDVDVDRYVRPLQKRWKAWTS